MRWDVFSTEIGREMEVTITLRPKMLSRLAPTITSTMRLRAPMAVRMAEPGKC